MLVHATFKPCGSYEKRSFNFVIAQFPWVIAHAVHNREKLHDNREGE